MNNRGSYVSQQLVKYQQQLAKQTEKYYLEKSRSVFAPQQKVNSPAKSPAEEPLVLPTKQEVLQRNSYDIEQFLQKFQNSPSKYQNPKELIRCMKTMEKTQAEQLEDAQKREQYKIEDEARREYLELEREKQREKQEKEKLLQSLGASLTLREKESLIEQQKLVVSDERLDKTQFSLDKYIDRQYIVASFLDMRNSTLCLQYDQVMRCCEFCNKMLVSQEFYEFVYRACQKCAYSKAIDVLINSFSDALMEKLTRFVSEKLQFMKLPKITKRQRSYLQKLIGSDDAFVQLAVSYIIARLSQFQLQPDPYRRFPLLCENGQEGNLLVSIF